MIDFTDFLKLSEIIQKPPEKKVYGAKQLYICGHPKTKENTYRMGFNKNGAPRNRCKQCNLLAVKLAQQKRADREKTKGKNSMVDVSLHKKPQDVTEAQQGNP